MTKTIIGAKKVSQETKTAEEPAQNFSSVNSEERELTEKEKRQIIRQVIEQGKDEAKYILTISEWEGFHENAETRVMDGKAEFVLLYSKLGKGEKVWEYAVIPKTTRVILRFDVKDDWGEEHTTLYVFALNGWKSFDLY